MLDNWIWKMAWRDSRGSRKRLLLFLSSMVIGVAALVAINSFGDNLEQAIDEQSKVLLGADMSLESDVPFAPETEALIHELGQQHTEGEILLVEVLKALSAYEFSGEAEWPKFRDCVMKYCQFERDHALREEKEILPRAEEALEAEDWEQIDAAFGENRDPMFGQDWSTEFSELFDQLVNRLPAPLGLGEVWK